MHLTPHINIRYKYRWLKTSSDIEESTISNMLIVDNSGKGSANHLHRHWTLILKNNKVHSGELKVIGGKTFIGGADGRENSGDWIHYITLDSEKEKQMIDKLCWLITYKDNMNRLYYSCASFKFFYGEGEQQHQWREETESKTYRKKRFKKRCKDYPFEHYLKKNKK